MGLVLLAEQTEPIRRLVALKLVARDQSDHTSRIRFQIERQVLARLAHPGIAQIFDAGTTPEGAAWFAMEFVPGQRLDAWWKSAQPTPRDGVQLFRDICRAFGHAHRAGVVHCDIKPANILIADIDGRPQPKIIDFGIARATGHIDPGDVGGTPDYVSPEQAAGRGEVDARSDVHALAATLRALLTGIRLRPWLEGCTKPSTDVFARIASADPTHATLAALEKLPLRRRRRIELATILDKALASDPTARYDDAHALADEFDRWLNDRPVVALPASTVYHASCWLRRHRALAATGLILALTIIGFSWQLTEQYHRTLAERDTAEQMVEILLDTFRAADPLQYPEGSITARELLAGATGRIARRELTSSARTRILIELGGVQQNLELYDDARISLRSALDSAHGDQLTEIEALLGRVDIDSGNFDAARTRAQASVDRHANIQSRAWIVAMLQLAEIAILVGDGAEAEARLSAVRDPAFADADAELARDWHLQTARLADDQAQVAEALLH
jgi:non-specific serine/threonine protein kinase/serine/threonine-protein kinase